MKSNVIEGKTVKLETITPNKLSFSLDELAFLSSLSKEFLRKEIRAGNLIAKKFGARILVMAEDWRLYTDSKNRYERKSNKN